MNVLREFLVPLTRRAVRVLAGVKETWFRKHSLPPCFCNDNTWILILSGPNHKIHSLSQHFHATGERTASSSVTGMFRGSFILEGWADVWKLLLGLSQPGASCMFWGMRELSTPLCPAASQSTASGHMTQQWKECLSPDLTVGLHLSFFLHSVRIGSFPIWHGRKTASALGDLTQLPQVSKKSKPWHVEQLLFIQTSWGPFGLFWKPQDIVLQESVCLSKLNSLSVTSSASLSLPWMPQWLG